MLNINNALSTWQYQHSTQYNSKGFTHMMTSSNGNIFRVTGHAFVRGIHRSPVNSPHKSQWRGALMFSLICVWIIGWVNNREAGDLRRYRVHYDVIVMQQGKDIPCIISWLISWYWNQYTSIMYFCKYMFLCSLQWRHNECYGVPNHQRLRCLLNRCSRRSSKKTQKLRLCAGNSQVTGELSTEKDSKAENASIWWRHHVSEIRHDLS